MEKPSLVLVEDNDGDITLIREALNGCSGGYDLKIFRLPDEAIAFFSDLALEGKLEWPDLIILDYNLPRVSGLEILRFLKTHESLKVIPTIVYSSSEYQRDIQDAYRLYVNSYIIKPTSIEEFCKTVEIMWKYWFHTVKLPNATHQN